MKARHLVTVQHLSREIYQPRHFPELNIEKLAVLDGGPPYNLPKHRLPGHLSQSERDWAYAKRALARGEAPSAVLDSISAFRSDKPDPRYYAELTVRKALQSLAHDADRELLAVDPHLAAAYRTRHSAR